MQTAILQKMKKEYSKKANEDLDKLKNVVLNAKLEAIQIIQDAEIDLKHMIAGFKFKDLGEEYKYQEFPLRSQLNYANHIVGVIVSVDVDRLPQFNFVMSDGSSSDFEF